MMKQDRKLILLISAVVIVAVASFAVFYLTSQQSSPISEYPAELQEILRANRGRIVVVDVMNTNCPPCVRQVKELREFVERKGSGVEVYSVSIEYPGYGRDTAETLARFIAENGVTWRIIVSDEPYTFISSLGIVGIPTILVLDGDGEIAYMHAGVIRSDDLLRIVSEIKS